jgi:hypothetical protein
MRALIAFFLMLLPASLLASNPVSLTSHVFVERIVKDHKGRSKAILEQPNTVLPGDRLVFLLRYQNAAQGNTRGNARDFLVTNPLPSSVIYQGSAIKTAQVSVDGGRTWGPLQSLSYRERSGTVRAARSEDVTHVRWPVPQGSTGTLSFRGIVR